MKLVADLHTHTCVSNHAFSTLREMVLQAKKNGLSALAITDHGVGMPDSPHPWYFNNLLHIPHFIEDGFFLLKGVEADAMDAFGTLDMDEAVLKKMDWVIVSLHRCCVPSLNFEQATNMWLAVAENPLVDMIGHSEQQHFLFDYDKVTRVFAKKNKVVELNAGSAYSRPGNEENLKKLALCCKKNGTKVAVNSDAHSAYNMGIEGDILAMLEEIEFPEKLVVNASMENLLAELVLRNKPAAKAAQKNNLL